MKTAAARVKMRRSDTEPTALPVIAPVLRGCEAGDPGEMGVDESGAPSIVAVAEGVASGC